MSTSQLSELVPNRAPYPLLPGIHLGGSDVVGLPSSRLIAYLVIDVVEAARFLHDLPHERELTLQQRLGSERRIFLPLRCSDSLEIVLTSKRIQGPDAVGITVTEKGQFDHDTQRRRRPEDRKSVV